jgi:hypothetical protein
MWKSRICLLLMCSVGCDVTEMMMPNSQPLPQDVGSLNPGDVEAFLEGRKLQRIILRPELETDLLTFLKTAKRTTIDGNVSSRTRIVVVCGSDQVASYDLERERKLLWGDGRQYDMSMEPELYDRLNMLAAEIDEPDSQ